jgi:hypothetical protein
VAGDVVVVVCLRFWAVAGSAVLPDSIHPETRTNAMSRQTKRMLDICRQW